MTPNHVLAGLQQVLADEFGGYSDNYPAHLDLNEIDGLDSMGALALVLALEGRFDVLISDEEVGSLFPTRPCPLMALSDDDFQTIGGTNVDSLANHIYSKIMKKTKVAA